MKIDTIGDIDWFAIPVPGQGYLNVVQEHSRRYEFGSPIFRRKRNGKQTKEKWITGELGLPATIPVYEADTIYFMLKDNIMQKHRKRPLLLKRILEEFDPYEP